MFKCFSALLWSRKEIIVANKMVVMNLLMPVLMLVLYQFMFKDQKDMNQTILWLVLPMVPAFVGSSLPSLVSEEAEKNNQRSLRLAGVKNWEYILASLVFPFLLILVYMVALPLYLQIDFSDLGWAYAPIFLITSAVIMLLFMGIALLVDTQARASILAMPIMMVSAFLPLFATMDKAVEKLVDWTYMGAFTAYTKEGTEFTLTDGRFVILLVWLVFSSAGILWIARKKALIQE